MFELNTLDNYSDETLISEIKRVALLINGQRFTQKKFLELSKVHVSTLRRRFGSWEKALELAGIDEKIAPKLTTISREIVIQAILLESQEFPDTSPTLESIAHRLGVHRTTLSGKYGAWQNLLLEVGLNPVPLGRRYTDEECFENIITLWTYYGRQPNFAELKQAPSTVGSKAYVTRWGGWRAALSAFIKHVNQPSAPLVVISSHTPQQEPEAIPLPISRSISLSLRYKILCRDHFKCVICGRSPAKDHSVELHVDHITPWSKGGQNTEENLRTLCFDCNLGKGDKEEHA